jgi:excisionase family DNA binding protein
MCERSNHWRDEEDRMSEPQPPRPCPHIDAAGLGADSKPDLAQDGEQADSPFAPCDDCPRDHRPITPPATPAPLVWTVEEAAAVLGIGRTAAYEGVRSGEIPAVRIGKRWVCPKAAVKRKFGLE